MGQQWSGKSEENVLEPCCEEGAPCGFHKRFGAGTVRSPERCRECGLAVFLCEHDAQAAVNA